MTRPNAGVVEPIPPCSTLRAGLPFESRTANRRLSRQRQREARKGVGQSLSIPIYQPGAGCRPNRAEIGLSRPPGLARQMPCPNAERGFAKRADPKRQRRYRHHGAFADLAPSGCRAGPWRLTLWRKTVAGSGGCPIPLSAGHRGTGTPQFRSPGDPQLRLGLAIRLRV